MITPTFTRCSTLAAISCLLSGCSSPAVDAKVTVEGPPFADFIPLQDDAGLMTAGVGDAMVRRCGSLDCHGSVGRNFRVFGNIGARLDPKAVVGLDNDNMTTPDEYRATYRSLTALEPEIMVAVLADHGVNPTRLTFIRKSRGTEHHKGGTVALIGDPLDHCFTTWLAGAADRRACNDAEEQ